MNCRFFELVWRAKVDFSAGQKDGPNNCSRKHFVMTRTSRQAEGKQKTALLLYPNTMTAAIMNLQ
jgi:hypothetical protein